MTLPLLLCVLAAVFRSQRRRRWAARGLVWAGFYLLLCAFQQSRASAAMYDLITKRGHQPVRSTVKPSFGNILVWRSIYEAGGNYYVDAVRPGWLGSVKIIEGPSTPVLPGPANTTQDWNGIPAGSTALADVVRFYHFSDGWVVWQPVSASDAEKGGAGDGKSQSVISTDSAAQRRVLGDLRYAHVPDQILPLWGISYQSQHPDVHARVENFRKAADRPWERLWAMIRGTAFER